MSKLLQDNGLFKHTHVFTGYAEGTPYLYYKDARGVIDGIGRQHINLYKKCDTCGKEVLVAMIHVQADGSLYGAKKEVKNEG